MKLMFWRTRAEITSKTITLDEYEIIKKWLADNKIKHKDRFGDRGMREDWGWAAWIEIKNKNGEGSEHTFQFYKEKDAMLFKMRWK